MHLWYLLSVWLHIIAAAAWIGGMIFFAAVVVPALRRPEHREAAPGLMHQLGLRFRLVGWIALVLLLVTGFVQLAHRGIGLDELGDAAFWRNAFGALLATKLGLVAVVLLLSAIHDFVLGPRASAQMRRDAASPDAARLRRAASWMGRLNLLLGLLAAALGVALVRGLPW